MWTPSIPRLLAPVVLLALGAAPALAQPLFDAPWIGYNVGVSAFPGSGTNSLERRPTVAEAVDLDGDGDLDLVVANQAYRGPGSPIDGSSGFVVVLNDGTGRFGEPAHYTASFQSSYGLGVGDFDEDGDPDVVVPRSGPVEQEGNTVRFYLNGGTGAFVQGDTYTVGRHPTKMVVADFDGDGHLDVVIACSANLLTPEPLSFLFGDGAGGFAHVTLDIQLHANHFAVGDLDGDGDPDLVVGGDSALDGYRFAVLMNDGAGAFTRTFLPHVQNFINYRYPVPTLADLDRDGALDLLYGAFPVDDRYKDLGMRYGNGDGTFGPEQILDLGEPGFAPRAFSVADLNGDGWTDVVMNQDAAGNTGGVYVALNDGTGGLVLPATFYAAGEKTVDVVAADLDGDGDADFVAADEFSLALMVYENPGDGVFRVLPSYNAIGLAIRLDAADLDGDGDRDAVASSEHFGSPCSVHHNDGTGAFTHVQTINGPGSCARAVLRDLDEDGDPDLLFGAADDTPPYDFFTAKNDGTGRFGPYTRWPVGACGPGDVEAVDLDGDGHRDVVVAEALGGSGCGDRLFVARGRGDGTFEPPYVVTTNLLPYALEAGDFDGDGDLDLATSHWAPYGARDFVTVLLNHGGGTFGPPVAYQTGQGPKDLVALDLDGDGHLDLASSNVGAEGIGRETMTVLYGTGTGAFAGRQDYYAPYSPDLLGTTGIAAGDVDGDGDPDLMVTTVAGGAALYVNEGGRAFSFTQRYGIARSPFDPSYADFDGDGVGDLLTLTSKPYAPQRLTLLPGLEGPTAPVAVSAEPVDPPVTIPPGGGRFRFTVTLTNTTDQTQTVQAWTAVSGPASREPVLGPMTVTLPPGASVTRTLTQQVPGAAPPGTYTYAVHVGTFGGDVLASDSFTFEKQGAARHEAASADADWSVSGWEEPPVAAPSVLPGGFALSDAHPNPFDGRAMLTLEVAAAQHIRAEVYDALGRRVAVLLDGAVEAGAHALVLDGASLPAGVYVVRVVGDAFSATRRATLVR